MSRCRDCFGVLALLWNDANEIKIHSLIIISEKRLCGSDWFCRIITRYWMIAGSQTVAASIMKALV